jgi:hypothetical protein
MTAEHAGGIVVLILALAAFLDSLLSPRLKRLSMNQTLGDDFTAYLAAQQAVAAGQAKLSADQAGLAQATATFHTDLAASGVKALLAPSANPDGSTAVAVVNPDGGFTVIVAAAPSTPVPAPAPVTPPGN